MLLRVNKNTGTKPQTVKYCALLTGTVSHVWYDDEEAEMRAPKRRNAIRLKTREQHLANSDRFDA